MKQFISAVITLSVGISMGYFALKTYINSKYFKGRIIDIIIVIAIDCIILIAVGSGLNIADYYFDIFPK